MFKHENGSEAKSRVNGFAGVITARANHLFGCNRYFLQPKINKEGKLDDGYWFDEDEVEITKKNAVSGTEKSTGGFHDRVK